MKVKIKVKKAEETYKQKRRVRTEDIRKIYESPKFYLKKTLEVIEMSVQENLSKLFEDYIGWRTGKAKRPEYIFNMLLDISFVSVLPKIVKNNYDVILEHGEEFSEMISSAVTELMGKRPPKAADMVAIYSKIYEDLNDERIKKIFNLGIDGLDWENSLKLCIVSHGTPRHTMNNTLRAIYSSVKTLKYDKLRKLFRKLYGKRDMDKVAVYILLERALERNKNPWINREQHSTITNIALDEISKRPKKEIKELLKLYCEERRRTEFNQFIPRRIRFSAINKDDYGKIVKVAKKLSEKSEMYRLFLDHTRVRKGKK